MSFHHTGSRATHHLDTSDILHLDYVGYCDKCPVTIDALPHDVLLHIFHLDRSIHLDGLDDFSRHPWRWDRLVHVCHLWRSIIFASPKFLDLKLVCHPWSPMEFTGIWPPLPIAIIVYGAYPEDYSFDAVTAHHNRAREIHLHGIRDSQIHRLASAMRAQFPALVHLSLTCDHFNAPLSLPDGFLDGSAPLLQSLKLQDFGFPALPNFLLSATHLIHLTFEETNLHHEYITPKEILDCLAVLSKLESLTLRFFPLASLDEEIRHAPPPASIVLPVLTHFMFDGCLGYLEALVARIDAPLLNSFQTYLYFQRTSDFPQLAQFLRRSTCFQPPNELHVDFRDPDMQIRSFPTRQGFHEGFGLKISCARSWDYSPLVKGFASLLPFIHMVDHLYIYSPSQHSSPGYDGYLEFFHLLTGVKNLYISSGLAGSITSELTDLVGERVAEVFPALECILLEDLQPSEYVQERIGQFTAARQLSGRPVAISTWNKTGDHFEF